MGEGIGSYLQQLRIKQGWTTTQLAQKAGVRRATLSEWQAGKRHPRLTELNTVLTTLGATDTQKRYARELLTDAHSVLRIHTETHTTQRELMETAGPAPHGGNLLRALRMRKGWTQTTLAEKMGVSQVTVVRWERAERWPDTESLHTLCYLLGAREEELTALTVGRFGLERGQPALNEESIREQLHTLYTLRYSPTDYALSELRLLTLIAQAWFLAAHDHSAGHLLANVYREYIDHLFMQRRFEECIVAANRTLDIYSASHQRDMQTDRVAIRLAESLSRRESKQGRDAAVSLLKQWLPIAAHTVNTGWILRDLAQMTAVAGDMDEAIALAREAMRLAEPNPDIFDAPHRRHDLASLLVKAGRAREAQQYLTTRSAHPFFLLVQAETYLGIGESITAYRLINEARAIMEHPMERITQPEIAFYRPVIENLAEQLMVQ